MSTYLIQDSTLTGIANAIRAKTGGSAAMTPAQMATEIGSISGGSSITVEPLTVTQNGTTTAPSGKAYSPVTVNVPQPSGRKVINISQNGTTYENIADYSSVKINVSVEAPQGTTTITSNGTVNVSEYAYAEVNVEPTIVYLNDGLNDGTATLANPFDGLNYQTLMYGMSSQHAIWNAFIAFQFQGMDVLYHPFAANNAINAMAFLPNDGQGNPIGAYASWNRYGALGSLYLLSGGQLQDLGSMAANIPVRTIIYGTTDPPRAD